MQKYISYSIYPKFMMLKYVFVFYNKKTPRYALAYRGVVYNLCSLLFCLRTYFAISIATATCTVAPTIGLLPIPRNPIISTCAGTEDEPAN